MYNIKDLTLVPRILGYTQQQQQQEQNMREYIVQWEVITNDGKVSCHATKELAVQCIVENNGGSVKAIWESAKA